MPELHPANIKDIKSHGSELVLFLQGKGKTESDDFVVIATPEAKEDVYIYQIYFHNLKRLEHAAEKRIKYGKR